MEEPVAITESSLLSILKSSSTHIDSAFKAIKYNSAASGTNSANRLSKAITELHKVSKRGDGRVSCKLAEVLCLRAMCMEESRKCSMNIFQDISEALDLWLSQKDPEHVSSNSLILLYYVADMLHLKGYMNYHSKIYEMIIRFYSWKYIELDKCLAMLWQSRSLNHGLCASPVSDTFIETLSKHSVEATSMELWRSCMERSQSQVGFKLSLSVISTLASPDSYNPATQPHVSITEVKMAASDLINNAPQPKKLFLAAQLYYDLAEITIARGLMVEALSYAKEADRLRTNLFTEHYTFRLAQPDANGEDQEWKRKIDFIKMKFSKASVAWPSDKCSSDFEDFIMTSWNVFRCYLESKLQVGTIEELVGNGFAAEATLQWGNNISFHQDLPLFAVYFSSALGKLYRKQHRWDLVESQLKKAKNILRDKDKLISCPKCKLVLQVTVEQQLADLYRSRFPSSIGTESVDEPSDVGATYMHAMDKLKNSIWENYTSTPKKIAAKNIGLYASLKIVGSDKVEAGEGSLSGSSGKGAQEKDCSDDCTCSIKCWHCLPSAIMKSSSLTSIIEMKWECIRKRLLLRLLIGTGKWFGVLGNIPKAHKVLIESISVLVSRSTFDPSQSASFPLLVNLIKENVVGEIFAGEQASIIYNVCWLYLKCFSKRNNRNTSGGMLILPVPIDVSGLKLSFILCREVPMLSQKGSCRLAKLIPDFENSVLQFFQRLPPITIVCISMIGDDLASLLSELLLYNPPTRSWIMLSRLNLDRVPASPFLTL